MSLHFLGYGFVYYFAQLPGQISELTLATFVALFFYTGPESILPVASGLTALIGLLLIVWQRLLHFLSRFIQAFQQRLARSVRGNKS
ncbi:MAG: hypothetical protein AB7U82_11645 [Blastocatellales bacterium]